MTMTNNRLGIGLFAAGVIAVLAFMGGRYSSSDRAPEKPQVAEAASAGPELLKVSPEALTLMDIEVLKPVRGALATPLVVPGLVTATPEGHAVITARVSGSVTRIEKHVGDAVKKSEALAWVASSDAAGLLSQQRTAEARLIQANANLERERHLFAQRVTPRQDLESAEAAAAAATAEAQSAQVASAALRFGPDGKGLILVSPIEGRVTQASAVLGGFVEANTELFRVADPRRVQIQVSIPGGEAAGIAVGNTARVVTQRSAALEATVIAVSPSIDARTGAASAVLSLTDPNALPSVGEGVRVYIQPHSENDADLIVPAESIQMLNGHEVVFVRVDDGFRAQPVSLGARNGAQVAVRQGLTGEESVAGRNAFLLKAEAGKGAEEDE
ncbi:MAG: efflux RND transporter periplasmic adaptor subunit [Pseudomonadota bacterium]